MTLEHYFQELAPESSTIKHTHLLQLSGLTGAELEQFRHWWPSLLPERRQAILERMVSMTEDSVEVDFNAIFRHCLSDADSTVRKLAVSGLWECDDHTLVGPMISLLKGDSSEEVRTSAATALGKFCSLAERGKLLQRDGERIKTALLSLLENDKESLETRRRALEAVACFNTTRIRELIRWAYSSAEPKLRTSALYAMGRTGDLDWLPVLFKELQNNDPMMRYEAASACGEMGDEEAIPGLIPLIQDDDLEVQLAAIRAVGSIGGVLSMRILKRCLKSDDEAIQEAAQEALQNLEVEEDPLTYKF